MIWPGRRNINPIAVQERIDSLESPSKVVQITPEASEGFSEWAEEDYRSLQEERREEEWQERESYDPQPVSDIGGGWFDDDDDDDEGQESIYGEEERRWAFRSRNRIMKVALSRERPTKIEDIVDEYFLDDFSRYIARMVLSGRSGVDEVREAVARSFPDDPRAKRMTTLNSAITDVVERLKGIGTES
jgi:hypothetical protein